jgi:hypothetical protein
MTALTWYTPRAGQWVARNSDHRYGVACTDTRFEAFHIEALFARPASLGCADSVSEAQALCQHHNDQPRPSAA